MFEPGAHIEPIPPIDPLAIPRRQCENQCKGRSTLVGLKVVSLQIAIRMQIID